MNLLDRYPNCYFRRCSKDEIITLFDDGIIRPLEKKYKFVSLSKSEHITSTNDDEYVVVYDKEKLLKQGAVEVQYTPEFMKNNNLIFQHISTEYFLQDGVPVFMEGKPQQWDGDYSPQTLREFGLPMSTTYEEYIRFRYQSLCDGRRGEAEVVIPRIILEFGLVKDILWFSDMMSIEPDDEPEIVDVLKNWMRNMSKNTIYSGK